MSFLLIVGKDFFPVVYEEPLSPIVHPSSTHFGDPHDQQSVSEQIYGEAG